MTPGFQSDEWTLRETELNLDRLAQTESVFALSNGHIGVRATLDEGEPHALPGTYLNSFYESRPLPYAEAGYGYPEDGQTVVNVTNGKLIRLLVDDEPFDVRYGEVGGHERLLDMRAGTLHRRTEWTSPGHRTVRVTSTRMVSLTQRAIMAIEWQVEMLDGAARVVVQSELVANEEVPPTSSDPRVAAALERPLRHIAHDTLDSTILMLHQTAQSRLRMAAVAHHHVEGPDDLEVHSDSQEDVGRFTCIATLRPGQTLRIVKFVAYGWSGERSVPALRDQVAAALSAARHVGWHGMLAEQEAYLSDFWDRADVTIDGDPQLQHAVRFALFHSLQAGARTEGRGIPAKGLTGPGYDGHKFWDTESFVLPVLTYTVPEAAGDALRWRHSLIETATQRAAMLGLQGSAFAWRTIAGPECSAYWPAGTAAFHINAAIADAVRRYVAADGGLGWERSYGVALLVATARLWASLGCFDAEGRFRIDGVTGPDEYSAVADNNVYTNLMAKRNLLEAADAVGRHPGSCVDVRAAEVATWRRAAEAMTVPFDDALGVHQQSEGFTAHETWDFDGVGGRYPLLLHFPYFDLYRKQVVKQADLVLAMFCCGDEFTDEEKAANFEYYEAVTVRDSSLSACTQSIMAAETGHLDLAYDYLGEAAFMDLDDLEHNTSDGLHIASLAGAWLAVVAGFGGMRDHGGRLSFRPRIPDALAGLSFRVVWNQARLQVDIRGAETTYCVAGGPVTFFHHGQTVELADGGEQTLKIPPITPRPRPHQPSGRVPARRIP